MTLLGFSVWLTVKASWEILDDCYKKKKTSLFYLLSDVKMVKFNYPVQYSDTRLAQNKNRNPQCFRFEERLIEQNVSEKWVTKESWTEAFQQWGRASNFFFCCGGTDGWFEIGTKCSETVRPRALFITPTCNQLQHGSEAFGFPPFLFPVSVAFEGQIWFAKVKHIWKGHRDPDYYQQANITEHSRLHRAGTDLPRFLFFFIFVCIIGRQL